MNIDKKEIKSRLRNLSWFWKNFAFFIDWEQIYWRMHLSHSLPKRPIFTETHLQVILTQVTQLMVIVYVGPTVISSQGEKNTLPDLSCKLV